MRVFWSGSISFGLVNIPVKLFPATRDHQTSFNQLHRDDGGRVRYRLICEACEQELSRADIVKGHEYSKGRYVTFESEELEALAVEASKSVDILDFVDLEQIDPLYFQKGYYMAPQKGAAKAYHLLRDALARTGKVAVATFVIRTSSHLALIRTIDQVLVLETMHYGDEVVPHQEVPLETAQPTEREVELAISLVKSLSVEFEPRKYKDTFQERLDEAISRKIEGQEVTIPAAPERAEIIDLMQALQASLGQASLEQTHPEFKAAMPEKKPRRRSGGKP